MAGYQRMVSYLYEYNRGEKGENVGFAKLEIREDIAKMIVNIRMRRDLTGSCPVEFYYREGRQAYRVPVGQIQMAGGRAEERILLPGAGAGESGFPVAQMNGILISVPGVMIGSAWDDQPVPVGTAIIKPVTESEETGEPEGELQAAELSIEDFEEEKVAEGEQLWKEQMQEEQTAEDGRDHTAIPAKLSDQAEPRLSAGPQSVDYFFQNGTRMCPFEDPAVTSCVRIEPADLEYLPKETWILGSNSFLLHGYFTYGHLILAKLKGMGRESVILGVPGQYQNQERFLAKMFGFEYFKPIGMQGSASAGMEEAEDGSFGYWYLFLPEMVD